MPDSDREYGSSLMLVIGRGGRKPGNQEAPIMKLIMQTSCSKMDFELQPDEVGELVQAAFRYASGMGQLQPGWSDGIVYQDSADPPVARNVSVEEETQGRYGWDAAGAENQDAQSTDAVQSEWDEKADEGVCQDRITGEDEPGTGYEGDSKEASSIYGSQEDPAWEQTTRKSDFRGGTAHHQDSTFMQPQHRTRKYKGFLLIKCQNCGRMKGFCSKEPIDTYVCKCGERIPLDNLLKAYASCECGSIWRYMTNQTESVFEINGLRCGSPIDLGYNARKRMYASLRDRR